MRKYTLIILSIILLAATLTHAAIDSQNERRAIIRLFDVPSGTVDISARYSLLGLYNSNVANAEPLPEDTTSEQDRLELRKRYSGGGIR